jgi:hypothetical protein
MWLLAAYSSPLCTSLIQSLTITCDGFHVLSAPRLAIHFEGTHNTNHHAQTIPTTILPAPTCSPTCLFPFHAASPTGNGSSANRRSIFKWFMFYYILLCKSILTKFIILRATNTTLFPVGRIWSVEWQVSAQVCCLPFRYLVIIILPRT